MASVRLGDSPASLVPLRNGAVSTLPVGVSQPIEEDKGQALSKAM